jgi:alpha-beta hydrolase superfamily lysophospholipase
MSDRPTSPVTPTWFASNGHQLAAWLHQPTGGRVRGGVVICGPIGRESIIAYPALRLLADDFARAGFLAMRFDYASTGNSTDHSSDELVRPWLGDISAAVAHMRACGCREVSLVGLRVGATLAAHAAPDCGPLQTLVVWDPCLSGRTFLREQRALQMLEIGHVADHEDGSQEALGFRYAPGTVADLRSLKLGDVDVDGVLRAISPSASILLLTRPEQVDRADLADFHGNDRVISEPAEEQDDFLGRRSFASTMPRDVLARIVSHVAQMATSDAHEVDVRTQAAATVGVAATGAEIVERLIPIGRKALAAVVTEASDLSPDAPTLICTNVAAEHLIGPGRAWVDFARRAARAGLRVIRFDRPGVGDSVAENNPDDVVMYTPQSREEVADTIRDVRSMVTGPIGLLGSCSGAWLTAAAGGRVGVDAAWLINLRTWAVNPVPKAGAQMAAVLEAVDRGEQVWADDWKSRVKQLIKARMPYRAWLSLSKRGSVQAPEPILADLAERGTSIHIHLAPVDLQRFNEQRGPEGVRRLIHGGAHIDVSVEPAADHALFGVVGRERILDRVLSQALGLRTDLDRVRL